MALVGTGEAYSMLYLAQKGWKKGVLAVKHGVVGIRNSRYQP